MKSWDVKGVCAFYLGRTYAVGGVVSRRFGNTKFGHTAIRQ